MHLHIKPNLNPWTHLFSVMFLNCGGLYLFIYFGSTTMFFLFNYMCNTSKFFPCTLSLLPTHNVLFRSHSWRAADEEVWLKAMNITAHTMSYKWKSQKFRWTHLWKWFPLEGFNKKYQTIAIIINLTQATWTYKLHSHT